MTTEKMWVAIITGSFTLGGGLLTILANTIKELLTNRNRIAIEKIKIFEGNQFDAYNELLIFINEIIPLLDPEEPIRECLININSSSEFNKIISQLGYYNSKIRKELLNIYQTIKFLEHPAFRMNPVKMTFTDLTTWRNNIEKEVLSYLKAR